MSKWRWAVNSTRGAPPQTLIRDLHFAHQIVQDNQRAGCYRPLHKSYHREDGSAPHRNEWITSIPFTQHKPLSVFCGLSAFRYSSRGGYQSLRSITTLLSDDLVFLKSFQSLNYIRWGMSVKLWCLLDGICKVRCFPC